MNFADNSRSCRRNVMNFVSGWTYVSLDFAVDPDPEILTEFLPLRIGPTV